MPQTEVKKRRRRRMALSCESCKSKKIKCDRKRPICGHCVRINGPCLYQGPQGWIEASDNHGDKVHSSVAPSASGATGATGATSRFKVQLPEKRPQAVGSYLATDGSTSVATLAVNGVVPYSDLRAGDLSDTMSAVVDDQGRSTQIFTVKPGRIMCSGTFSLYSMWKQDPLMNALRSNFWMVQNSLRDKISQSAASKTNGPEDTGLTRQVKLRKRALQTKGTASEVDGDLKQRIASLFPPRDVLKDLIGLFFRRVYPFFPLFDQPTVEAYCERIVHYTDDLDLDPDSTAVSLSFDKKVDYVRAATLLLIARFAFISVRLEYESNSPLMQKSKYERIMRFPVESNVVATLDLALQKVNFLRKISIEVFQAVLLMRQYQVLTPDDGDGGDFSDGVVYMGMITSDALAMGLNRKIEDDFPVMKVAASSPGAFRNLWGKMWWSMLVSDLEMSMVNGRKPFTDITNFDNELPNKGAPNAVDPKIDEFSVNQLTTFSQIYEVLFELLSSLHRIRNPPPVAHTEALLAETCRLRKQLYSPSTDYADELPEYFGTDQKSLSVVLSNKMCMVMDKMMISVEQYLLLHYEKTHNLAAFEYLLPDMVDHFLVACEISCDTFDKVFTSMAAHTLVLVPYILTFVAGNVDLFIFLCVRVLLAQSKVFDSAGPAVTPEEKTRFDILDKLYAKITQTMKILCKCYSLSQNTYYCAYRGTSMSRAMVDWLSNRGRPVFEFSKGKMQDYPNLIEKVSDASLSRISERFDRFLFSNAAQRLGARQTGWTSTEGHMLTVSSSSSPPVSIPQTLSPPGDLIGPEQAGWCTTTTTNGTPANGTPNNNFGMESLFDDPQLADAMNMLTEVFPLDDSSLGDYSQVR